MFSGDEKKDANLEQSSSFFPVQRARGGLGFQGYSIHVINS